MSVESLKIRLHFSLKMQSKRVLLIINKDHKRSSAKNSLKSLKIQSPPPIQAIFIPLTIRNGFLIKVKVANQKSVGRQS